MARTKGAKAAKYDESNAMTVRALSQYGVPQEDIAAQIGCCVETMVGLYAREMAEGRAVANAKIGKRLFAKAMDGDTASLIFWAKTRMGWRETQKVDVTSSDGTMSPVPLTINLADLSAEEIATKVRAVFRGEAVPYDGAAVKQAVKQ